jgi:hypothetical protein
MTIVRATFWTSLASTEDYRVMRNISVCADINPDYAVDIYCGLKIHATALVSRFWSSTY